MAFSRLLITNSDGSEYLGKFDQDGGVELYYDNNKKLETATDGVNVTGGLTVTGEVTGGRIKVVGIVTGASTIIGAGSSTDGVESPVFPGSNNNPTIVGTSGTTGEIKMIGGIHSFMMDPSGESLSFLVEHQYQHLKILTGIVLFLEMILIPHLRIKNLDKQFIQELLMLIWLHHQLRLVQNRQELDIQMMEVCCIQREMNMILEVWTIEGWFYLDTLPQVQVVIQHR